VHSTSICWSIVKLQLSTPVSSLVFSASAVVQVLVVSKYAAKENLDMDSLHEEKEESDYRYYQTVQ